MRNSEFRSVGSRLRPQSWAVLNSEVCILYSATHKKREGHLQLHCHMSRYTLPLKPRWTLQKHDFGRRLPWMTPSLPLEPRFGNSQKGGGQNVSSKTSFGGLRKWDSSRLCPFPLRRTFPNMASRFHVQRPIAPCPQTQQNNPLKFFVMEFEKAQFKFAAIVNLVMSTSPSPYAAMPLSLYQTHTFTTGFERTLTQRPHRILEGEALTTKKFSP